MIFVLGNDKLESDGISKRQWDDLGRLLKSYLINDASLITDKRERFIFQQNVLKFDYTSGDVVDNLSRLDLRVDFIFFAFKDNPDFDREKALEIANNLDLLNDTQVITELMKLSFGEEKKTANPTESNHQTSE